jgi:nucleoside-diphosphate-sugar epimerase
MLIGEKYMNTVLVTGGSSMIGRSICASLSGYKVVAPTHSECDLLNPNNVQMLLHNFQPDYIIHAAGWNGGISWNAKYPATIYEKTVRMCLNLYGAAKIVPNLKKIVGIISSCAYPDTLDGTYDERDLSNGLPNNSVECHGLAKRTLFDFGRQLFKEHNIPCISTVLTNSFGPHDSFHPQKTKVIGAVIRKVVEAKQNNLPEIVCWGTGAPLRQFIYSKDVGPIMKKIMLEYNDCFSPINIGSPYEVSIKDITNIIAECANYKGNIVWDTTKPDGQMRKYLQTNKLLRLFDVQYTDIKVAIKETIDWYTQHKEYADAKCF